MKTKKYLPLFCAALLSVSAFCGCGAEETTQDDPAVSQMEEETPEQYALGEVLSIEDTTVTLALRNGMGREKPEGEPPADGDMPEKPAGDIPEKPENIDGEKPDDMPERPEDKTTVSVDLSAFDTVDASAVAVGDLLSVTLDSEGGVLSVEPADLSEMPEMPERPSENE